MDAEEINRRTFADRGVVSRYARLPGLFECEELIFRRFRKHFVGRVLDIGVGAGRTSLALLPAAARYVGVDLSKAMIDVARAALPTADLRVMDMRDVPAAFRNERFDVILMSYNTIDLVGWECRNRLLEQLRPLLVPGGLLVFSTHSLDRAKSAPPKFRIALPGTGELRQHPVRWLANVLRQARWTCVALPNRLRNRTLERQHDGFSYLNDSGEHYGLVNVYVTEARQRAVLAGLGYEVLAVVPTQATPETSDWNYFVCRASHD